MPRQTQVSEALLQYAVGQGVAPEPFLLALREETQKLPGAQMQIGEDQGQFMRWLARVSGAKRCIEVGVFTGYSTLSVALGLPEDGYILGCDINPDTTAIALRYFKQAGLDHKFELRLAPALETLDSLLEQPAQHESFDMAFLDADKERYPEYYERLLALLRPGGILLADNVLWGGSVIKDADHRESTEGIRRFNAQVAADPRVEGCMLTIGDGLFLVRKN